MSPLKDIKIKKRTKTMIIVYYFQILTNNLKAIVIAMNKANLECLLVDPFLNKIICIQQETQSINQVKDNSTTPVVYSTK